MSESVGDRRSDLFGMSGDLVRALAILAGALAMGIWTFDQKLSLSGDNTEFIILARSLVQGHGLSVINGPEPLVATKFPFGLPLMLAPMEFLFPGEWVPMKIVVLLCFAAAMPVFHVLVRDALGSRCALVSTALALSQYMLLYYSSQVMSEIPYLLFSLLALWLLGRSMHRPGILNNHAFLVGGLCAIWAYNVRSVGLILILAVVIYLLGHRLWHKAAAMAGSAVLLGLPWAWRNHQAQGEKYLTSILKVNAYDPAAGQLGLAGLMDRVSGHTTEYLRDILPPMFWPWWDVTDTLLNPVSLILMTLGLAALILVIRRREHILLALYVVLTIGTLLLWPWTGDRFFVPILPLLLFFGVWVISEGLRAFPEKMKVQGQSFAVPVALGLVAAVYLPAVNRLADIAEEGYPPVWARYREAGLWLRDHTPPETLVACRKPYWLHVVSGRHAIAYPRRSPAELMAFMDSARVDYIVPESLGFNSSPQYLLPMVSQYAERFEVMWSNLETPTAVMRLRSSTASD